MSGTLDVRPSYYYWTVNNRMRYYSDVYGIDGAEYTVLGPVLTFSLIPLTVKLVAVHGDASTTLVEYTTADGTTPSVSITLLERKHGEPVSSAAVPQTPIVSSVAGRNRIAVDWITGHTGNRRADVSLRVDAEDMGYGVDYVRVAWGDGDTDDYEGFNYGRTVHVVEHQYALTGATSVTASSYRPNGDPGPSGALNVTVLPDATGWRADQFRIQRYQSQVGFRETDDAGWQSITDDVKSFTIYNALRSREHFVRLQLRELDATGRPIRTSAFSAPASVGPWA